MSTDLDQLQLFNGAIDSHEARIYARVPRQPMWRDGRLAGAITGPWCMHARTLTASAPFRDQGVQREGEVERLLAEALLLDPCCWTPETPFLYMARVELRIDGALSCLVERQFGLRRLGVRDGKIHWDGERWTPRIANWDRAGDRGLARFRELGLAAEVVRPLDDFCQEASRLGVALVAHAAGRPDEIIAELRRLHRHAAVTAIVVERHATFDASLRRQAPGVLLIESLTGGEAIEPAAWAHLAVVDHSKLDAISARGGTTAPVLLRRAKSEVQTAEELAAACQSLESDSAARAECVGFWV